jgi:hypothetical protein
MIQRIQSIFLFASLCFLASMFFFPLAGIDSGGTLYTFDLTGFFSAALGETQAVDRQYSLMIYGILVCALNAVTIFMYRQRVLQMRLCVYNIILIIGLLGVVLYIIWMSPKESVQFNLPVVFPLVAGILHYLAFRGIRKDDVMVQALSRLR